jgi:hypothetical protein
MRRECKLVVSNQRGLEWRTLTWRHAVHAIDVRLGGAFSRPCARVLRFITTWVVAGEREMLVSKRRTSHLVVGRSWHRRLATVVMAPAILYTSRVVIWISSNSYLVYFATLRIVQFSLLFSNVGLNQWLNKT